MVSLKNKKSRLEMVSNNYFEFALFYILPLLVIGYAKPLSLLEART